MCTAPLCMYDSRVRYWSLLQSGNLGFSPFVAGCSHKTALESEKPVVSTANTVQYLTQSPIHGQKGHESMTCNGQACGTLDL